MNRQLINLPIVGKELLLKLANASWNHNEILPDWKISKVIMFDKKDCVKSDPRNYSPISLTNSVIKLIEKQFKRRLEKFIETNNIINPFQSGFQNIGRQSFLFDRKNLQRTIKKSEK